MKRILWRSVIVVFAVLVISTISVGFLPTNSRQKVKVRVRSDWYEPRPGEKPAFSLQGYPMSAKVEQGADISWVKTKEETIVTIKLKGPWAISSEVPREKKGKRQR